MKTTQKATVKKIIAIAVLIVLLILFRLFAGIYTEDIELK